MNKKKFEKLFLELIKNKKNKFHPLVWINGNPKIGKNTYIGGFSEINAKGSEVKIGNNCDIASFVSINVADSHKKTIKISNKIDKRKITIGDRVFIGSHSVVLGGTTIGSYSTIAAGTVVRPSRIPSFSLVYGNPMKIKRNYYKKNKR